MTAEQLNPLGEVLNSDSLSIVLAQFASSVRAERIAEAMLDSTARIFDLIRAIKDYSYMDQAPIQEVDVRQALENTLTMLQSRLTNVEIERRYEDDLPLIAAYGSELNQVWMALLENALDAIQDHGRITLGVQLSGDMLLIEVWDNGPGIPRGSAGSHLRALFHNQGSRLRPRPWFRHRAARCSPPPRLHPRAVGAGRNLLPGAAAH